MTLSLDVHGFYDLGITCEDVAKATPSQPVNLFENHVMDLEDRVHSFGL